MTSAVQPRQAVFLILAGMMALGFTDNFSPIYLLKVHFGSFTLFVVALFSWLYSWHQPWVQERFDHTNCWLFLGEACFRQVPY